MQKKLKLLTKNTDINAIKTSICKYCGDYFIITDLEIKLLDKHCFKHPEHCPLCNFKLLYSLLNDKHLYHRKDSKTWRKIISTYSESFSWDIYEANKYKKLVLDDFGLKFSKEISGDIFSQFNKLYNDFPKASRLIYPGLENAEYSSHTWWSKNIYLSYCVFIDCEDIYYSLRVLWWCKNIYNSFNITWSSNIYTSRNIWNSHNIYFWETMIDCSNLLFSKDMNNCKECIFCCNQLNSKYKIFNKQYEKEEYQKIKKDIYKMINNKEQFKILMQKYQIFLNNNIIQESTDTNRCEKVVGENTFDSNNSINTFISSWLENCVNNMAIWNPDTNKISNIFNCVEAGWNCENCIWSSSFGTNIYNIFFSFWVVESSKNIYYSMDIESCEECMFCSWLKGKKYCILNKEYEKEKYFKLKENIIKKLKEENKWWDPLPFLFTWYPYNDTLAYDYFKINKVININWSEEIIDKNSKWIVKLFSDDFISDAELDLWWKEKIKIRWRTKNKEINIPENADTIKAEDLPEIQEIDEDILNKVIICTETWRPFKIIKQELDFLKKHNLPLPTIHNELRIDKLINTRPTWELQLWTCDKCRQETLTVYKEKPKHKIYCNTCYKNFMYK